MKLKEMLRLRVKVFKCKKCNGILRKLSYSIADKKLESGYTRPKTIPTNFYLCSNCNEVDEIAS